ncbi:MAG: LysR family transcriptional regulator [Marinosulfonomonas sp.]
MDWRSVKFDWNRARAFLVTAEEGSLSAAARALGMAQPTLGRQVDALEQELGLALFERAGRGVTLTPGGLELLEHVRAMGDAATRVSLVAAGQTDSIEGEVLIAASELYAAHILPPIVAKLRQQQPGIRLELVAANTPSDLRRREADIAIRNFRPAEPDLIARKIADAKARLYASPNYLDRLGPPKTAYDLRQAEFISLGDTAPMIAALNGLGLNITDGNFPVTAENHLVMWAMVKAGLGIGVVDATVGDADPDVVQVLPDLEPILFPVWLVAHRDLNTSRRIRMVFDLIAEELSSMR